ncbi:MAG: DNA-binding protein [Microbacteriaceae bacterium]
MFAITADQVDSRGRADLADEALRLIESIAAGRLVLPADRTAGDEVQALTDDPAAALEVILALTRTGSWSVGCGIGSVRTPLPDQTRAATGDAFILARDAVDAAKRRPTRVSIRIADDRRLADGDVEPLLDLLLLLRSRRSDEGWQLHEVLAEGVTQTEAARRLDISPQAVSQRAQTAQLRVDDLARPALARLLADADTPRKDAS